MSKKLISLFGLIVPFSMAIAGNWEDEMNRCSSSDAVCVGKVLLKARAGAGSRDRVIEYYHSDSCSSDLLATLTSTSGDRVSLCEALAEGISQNVWAIKVNGQCQDIVDANFKSACLRFQ